MFVQNFSEHQRRSALLTRVRIAILTQLLARLLVLVVIVLVRLPD